MRKVKFYGWKEGMRKIPFTKLLHEGGGISLREAKDICDGVLYEQEFVLEFKDEQTALSIFNKAVEFKVKCELID
jgi:hypothetical protein